ncbi:MAG: potassium/proton antiporter [Dokdonella sp.]
MPRMHAIDQNYLLLGGAALLVLAGIGSSLIARRFGAPLLLVFLVIGMLAGVDGPGGIQFSDYDFAYRIGSIALVVILFYGGLRTRFATVRSVLAPTFLLSTVCVALTALMAGGAAMWLFDLDFGHGLLVGSVVASTDAAAVLFLLRAGGLQLREKIGATLEIESSANDPTAILLTMLIVEYLSLPNGLAPLAIAREFVMEFGLGAIAGVIGGLAIVQGLRKLPLGNALAALFAAFAAIALFGIAGRIGGSGFLAVYVAGLMVGNRTVPGQVSLLSTLDAMIWLAQIAMFLVLGLLASPSALVDIGWPALFLAIFLMLVARPIAVTACLAPLRRFGKREIAFISWIGLRGAVGIFLASIPMLAHLPGAYLIFNIAFVVVLVSLLVQGWTLGVAARVFDVALPHRERIVRRVELDLPGSLERELVGYPVAADAVVLSGREIPAWAQLTMVVRDGVIMPKDAAGSLQVGDYAYLLAPPGRLRRLDWLFAPPEEAMETERELFGEFTFDADVALADVAGFYGVPIRPRDAALTLREHFDHHYEDTIEVGDRVPLGPITLIARDLTDDGVSQVGLKFEARSNVLARKAQRQVSLFAKWLRRR